MKPAHWVGFFGVPFTVFVGFLYCIALFILLMSLREKLLRHIYNFRKNMLFKLTNSLRIKIYATIRVHC